MDEVSSQPVFSVWGSGSLKLLCAPRVHNERENPLWLSYGPAKIQLQSLISFSCFIALRSEFWEASHDAALPLWYPVDLIQRTLNSFPSLEL